MAGRADRDQQSAGVHGGGGSREPGRTGRGGAPTPGRKPAPGPTTSYGAPIHFDQTTNPVTKGITIAAGPALMQQNEQRAKIYNDAAHEWNASAIKPSLGNFFNKVAPFGLSMEPPDIKRPATFSDGTYHMGWNPGSLLGLASPVPGGGIITGALGQAAYTAAGLPNAMISGPGKMGMKNFTTPPSTMGSPFGVAAPPANDNMAGLGQNMMPKPSQGGVPWLSALGKRPGLGQSMGA